MKETPKNRQKNSPFNSEFYVREQHSVNTVVETRKSANMKHTKEDSRTFTQLG